MTLERENGEVLTFLRMLLTNFSWFAFPFFRSSANRFISNTIKTIKASHETF